MVHPHLARNMGEYSVAVIHLHPEHRVGQRLDDLGLHLDCVFLAHGFSSSPFIRICADARGDARRDDGRHGAERKSSCDVTRRHGQEGADAPDGITRSAPAAHARHLLGEIATHPDRFEAETGEARYHNALALAEPRGMRPLVAHCHLGLGRLFRSTGKHEQQAQEHLTTSTTMYREMDMRFWLAQAAAEMAGPALMRYPQCQQENPTQAKFCPECATPLARQCANCGTPLPASAKFCLECAHPVGASRTEPGRAEVQARFASPESYTPKTSPRRS